MNGKPTMSASSTYQRFTGFDQLYHGHVTSAVVRETVLLVELGTKGGAEVPGGDLVVAVQQSLDITI